MQRRSAAILAAFFLVIAAGSYAVIGVAEEPTVTLDNPDHSLSAGDTVTLGERTYTVGSVSAGTNEGNDLRSVDLGWVNESARYTAELEANGTVPPADVTWSGQSVPDDEAYRVQVEDAADPSSFTLVQEFNVSGRLAADPAVEDETVTRADGDRYVVYAENGSTRPLADYLPTAEQRTFAEGETVRYQGNDTTVASVTNETVVLAWTAPRTNQLSLAEGDTTTAGGTEYVAHFPDNRTLVLTSDVSAYEDAVATVETYHERINGFWGVSIISGLASVLLIGLAYLPSRY